MSARAYAWIVVAAFCFAVILTSGCGGSEDPQREQFNDPQKEIRQ